MPDVTAPTGDSPSWQPLTAAQQAQGQHLNTIVDNLTTAVQLLINGISSASNINLTAGETSGLQSLQDDLAQLQAYAVQANQLLDHPPVSSGALNSLTSNIQATLGKLSQDESSAVAGLPSSLATQVARLTGAVTSFVNGFGPVISLMQATNTNAASRQQALEEFLSVFLVAQASQGRTISNEVTNLSGLLTSTQLANVNTVASDTLSLWEAAMGLTPSLTASLDANTLSSIRSNMQQLSDVLARARSLLQAGPVSSATLSQIANDVSTAVRNLANLASGPGIGSQLSSLLTNYTNLLSGFVVQLNSHTANALQQLVLVGDISQLGQNQVLSQALARASNALGIPFGGDALWGTVLQLVFSKLMTHVEGKINYFNQVITIENAGEQDFVKLLAGVAIWAGATGAGAAGAGAAGNHLPTRLNLPTHATAGAIAQFRQEVAQIHAFVGGAGFGTLTSKFRRYIADLHHRGTLGVTYTTDAGGHKHKELTRIVNAANSLSAKLAQFVQAARGIAALTTGGLNANTAVPQNILNQIAQFNAAVPNFVSGVRQDSTTLTNTNQAAQAQLRLQVMYYQEILQAVPTLLQTMKDLSSSIANNLKGGG